MKNKEKFKEEIVELAREEDRLKYRKRANSCTGCFGAANEDCSECKHN